MANENEIVLNIKAKADEARKVFQDLGGDVGKIDKATENLNSKSENLAKTQDKIGKVYKETYDIILGLAKEAGEKQEKAEKIATKAAQEETKQLKELAEKQEEALSKAVSRVEKEIAVINKKQAAVEQAAAKEQAAQQKAKEKADQNTQKEIEAQEKAAQKAEEKAAREIAAQEKQAKKAEEAAQRIAERLKALSVNESGSGGSFKEFAALAADLTIVAKGLSVATDRARELAGAAFEAVKKLAEQDTALTNLSNVTGASKAAIAALQSEFVKLGESEESVRGGLSQFGGFLADALANPASEAAQQAKLLGINLDIVRKSLNPFDTALAQVSKTTNGSTSSIQQFRAATLAFGEDDAPKVISALKNLDEKIADVQARGSILSPEQSAQAQELFQKLGGLTGSVDGLSKQLLAELLPSVNEVLSIAKEGLASVNQDSIEGIKLGIQEIGRGLVAIAPVVTKTFSLAIDLAGSFGRAVSAITNPFDTLTGTVKENAEVTEKANLANKNLATTFQGAVLVVDELTKKIADLNVSQSVKLVEAELSAQVALENLDRAVRQGTKTAEQAAIEQKQIQKDKLAAQDNALNQERSIIAKSINDNLKAREKESAESENLAKKTTQTRIAAQKDLDDFLARNSDRLTSLFKERSEQQKKLDNTTYENQKGIYREKIALLDKEINSLENQQTQKFNVFKISETNEIQSKKRVAAATENLAKLEKALALDRPVTEAEVGKQEFALRKLLIDNKIKLNKVFRDQNKADTEAEIQQEQGIVKDKNTNIDKINKAEQQATADLQKEYNKRQVNDQEFNAKTLLNTIFYSKQKLVEEEAALKKLKALEGDKAASVIALEKDVAARKAQINADERTKKIQEAQNDLDNAKASLEAQQTLNQAFFQSRQNQINNIKDLTKQEQEQQRLSIDIANQIALDTLTQVDLEEKKLTLLKAQGGTNEQIQQQENNILLTIQKEIAAREDADRKEKQAKQDKINKQKEALAQGDQENAQIVDRAARSKSAAAVIADSEQKVFTSIADTKSIAEQTIDELEKRRDALRASAGYIDAFFQFGGKDVVVGQTLDIADKLNQEIYNRLAAAQQKQADLKLEELQKEKSEAFDIIKQEIKDEEKLREESKTNRKKIKDEIIQNAKDEAKELDDLHTKQQQNLDAFDDQERQKALEKADQQHDALLSKEAAFEANLLEIKDKAQKEGAAKKVAADEKALEIDAQLQDLLAKRDAERDPAKRKDLDSQIKTKQEELAQADKKEEDRASREKRRQEAIAKAQKDAQEKIKGAKSDTEIEEIQKSLGIQIDGINEKFTNEQNFAEKLAGFQGKVSQERLDKYKADFEAEQAIVDQNVQNRIAAEKRQADLVEAARKKAEDKEKADAEARRQKLIDDQKKEYDDRKKSFDDKDTQLKDALNSERDAYKSHLDELRTKTAESLANIASSFTDGGAAAEKFFKDFAANAGLTGKAIDDILAKLGQFKSQINSDNTQKTNATGNQQANQQGDKGGINNGLTPGSVQQSGFGLTDRDSAGDKSTSNPTSKPDNKPSDKGNDKGNDKSSSTNNVNPDQKGNSKPDLNVDKSSNPSGANPSPVNPDSGKNPGQGGNPDDQGSISLEPKSLAEYEKICQRIYKKFNGDPKTDHYSVKLFLLVQNLILANKLSLGSPNPKLGFIDSSTVFNLTETGQTPAIKKSQKGDFDKVTKELINIVQDALNKKGKDEKKEDDKPPAKTTPGGDGKSADVGGKKAISDTPDSGVITRTGGSSAPDRAGNKAGAKAKAQQDKDDAVSEGRNKDAGGNVDEVEESGLGALRNVKADQAIDPRVRGGNKPPTNNTSVTQSPANAAKPSVTNAQTINVQPSVVIPVTVIKEADFSLEKAVPAFTQIVNDEGHIAGNQLVTAITNRVLQKIKQGVS